MNKYVATPNLAFASMRTSSEKAGNEIPYQAKILCIWCMWLKASLPSFGLRIVNLSKYVEEAWKGLKMTTFKVKFVYSDTGWKLGASWMQWMFCIYIWFIAEQVVCCLYTPAGSLSGIQQLFLFTLPNWVAHKCINQDAECRYTIEIFII